MQPPHPSASGMLSNYGYAQGNPAFSWPSANPQPGTFPGGFSGAPGPMHGQAPTQINGQQMQAWPGVQMPFPQPISSMNPQFGAAGLPRPPFMWDSRFATQQSAPCYPQPMMSMGPQSSCHNSSGLADMQMQGSALHLDYNNAGTASAAQVGNPQQTNWSRPDPSAYLNSGFQRPPAPSYSMPHLHQHPSMSMPTSAPLPSSSDMHMSGMQQGSAFAPPVARYSPAVSSGDRTAVPAGSVRHSSSPAGSTQQQQQTAPQQQQPYASNPKPRAASMREALGAKAFSSVRSLMLQQQSIYVQQLFELYKLCQVQKLLMSELQASASEGTDFGAAAAVSQLGLSSHQPSNGQRHVAPPGPESSSRRINLGSAPAQASCGVSAHRQDPVQPQAQQKPQVYTYASNLGHLPKTMRKIAAKDNAVDEQRGRGNRAAGMQVGFQPRLGQVVARPVPMYLIPLELSGDMGPAHSVQPTVQQCMPDDAASPQDELSPTRQPASSPPEELKELVGGTWKYAQQEVQQASPSLAKPQHMDSAFHKVTQQDTKKASESEPVLSPKALPHNTPTIWEEEDRNDAAEKALVPRAQQPQPPSMVQPVDMQAAWFEKHFQQGRPSTSAASGSLHDRPAQPTAAASLGARRQSDMAHALPDRGAAGSAGAELGQPVRWWKHELMTFGDVGTAAASAPAVMGPDGQAVGGSVLPPHKKRAKYGAESGDQAPMENHVMFRMGTAGEPVVGAKPGGGFHVFKPPSARRERSKAGSNRLTNNELAEDNCSGGSANGSVVAQPHLESPGRTASQHKPERASSGSGDATAARNVKSSVKSAAGILLSLAAQV